MVNDWNIVISNIKIPIYMVTDNARNINSGFKYYNNNNTLNYYFCAIHILQLAIDDALNENNMGSILKKCRSIATHYNLSTKSMVHLEEIQSD